MTGPEPSDPDFVDRIDPMPLIDPDRRLVLITNAKCGGSSMKLQFFRMLDLPTRPWQAIALARKTSPLFAKDFHVGSGARRYRALAADQNVGPFTGFYNRRVSRHHLMSACGPGWRKVAIVRDPFARCVSAYLDKFCTDNRFRPWAADVVAAAGKDGAMSFHQFVQYLETTDNEIVNRHWRRQTFVIDAMGTGVEMVRLERLAEDIAALQPALPDALQVHPKLNASRFRSTAPDTASKIPVPDISNLTLIDTRAKGQPTPRPDDFLTPEIKARLRKVYARDFARLPYA